MPKKNTSGNPKEGHLQKCPTGIPGLDEVMAFSASGRRLFAMPQSAARHYLKWSFWFTVLRVNKF